MHTIGDCYVAITEPGTKLQALLNFSERMLEAIQTVREFAKTDLVELRVGIHFGEFVGGLVGTKVLRYGFFEQSSFSSVDNELNLKFEFSIFCFSK